MNYIKNMAWLVSISIVFAVALVVFLIKVKVEDVGGY